MTNSVPAVDILCVFLLALAVLVGWLCGDVWGLLRPAFYVCIGAQVGSLVTVRAILASRRDP